MHTHEEYVLDRQHYSLMANKSHITPIGCTDICIDVQGQPLGSFASGSQQQQHLNGGLGEWSSFVQMCGCGGLGGGVSARVRAHISGGRGQRSTC